MNLIVTCPRNFEDEAIFEAQSILKDEKAQIRYSGISGIITVTTRTNPDVFVNDVRRLLLDEPWQVRYVLRAIPIHASTTTDMTDISREACRLACRMKEDESYRITIEKRNTNIHKADIISEVAEKIPNRVALDDPDWILMIQIIGGVTGLSLLRDSQILSVQKEKRVASE